MWSCAITLGFRENADTMLQPREWTDSQHPAGTAREGPTASHWPWLSRGMKTEIVTWDARTLSLANLLARNCYRRNAATKNIKFRYSVASCNNLGALHLFSLPDEWVCYERTARFIAHAFVSSVLAQIVCLYRDFYDAQSHWKIFSNAAIYRRTAEVMFWWRSLEMVQTKSGYYYECGVREVHTFEHVWMYHVWMCTHAY